MTDDPPFFIEADFDISIWEIDFGDRVRDELERVARAKGLDPDDYEWNSVSINVRAYNYNDVRM